MRFKAITDGKEVLLKGGDPVIESPAAGKLHISWPLDIQGSTLTMDIDEKQVSINVKGRKTIDWYLDMTTADKAVLPFKTISTGKIDCSFEGMDYSVTALNGTFSKPNDQTVFRVTPRKNAIQLDLSGRK